MGCFVAEAFSGSVIELVGHEGEIWVGEVIEGHFLWKEPANEAVTVFVGTPLPRGVGVGEVEVGLQLFGDALVEGDECLMLTGTDDQVPFPVAQSARADGRG